MKWLGDKGSSNLPSTYQEVMQLLGLVSFIIRLAMEVYRMLHKANTSRKRVGKPPDKQPTPDKDSP
jgi:hypothetical protein